MTPEEKLAKLPLWARTEIGGLQNHIAHLEQMVRTLTSDETTAVVIEPYAIGEKERAYLPRHTTIGFDTPDGMITARMDSTGELVIMASGSIVVAPNAANTCTIKARY